MNSPSLKSNATKYGLMLGMLIVIYGLILLLVGISREQWASYPDYLFIIIALYLCLKTYRDKLNGGYMTFGEGFRSGAMVTFLSSSISGLYVYLMAAVIDPGMIDFVMEQAEMEMEASGNSDKEIEMAMEWMEKMMTPIFFGFMVWISFGIFGGVVSLITSAIMKKDPPQQIHESVAVE